MRNRTNVAFLAALFAVACNRGATIEGEVSNGATKGAYQMVSLVRNPGDSLASAVDAMCAADRADIQGTKDRIQRWQTELETFRSRLNPRLSSVAQVALGDSIDKYRTAATDAQRALNERPDTLHGKIVELLVAATDTQIQADKEGQFRFAKRKPGKYWLYAEWVTNRAGNEFLAPVDARKGGKVKQSLDQSTISSRLRCR